VTHFVVKVKEDGSRRVVPIDLIVDTEPTALTIRLMSTDMTQLPIFKGMRYVKLTDSSLKDAIRYPAEDTVLHPYSTPAAGTLAEDGIPAETLAIYKGTKVHTVDGYVGRVEELLVSPVDSHVTHLILHKDNFMARDEIVTIPLSYIDRVVDELVYLNITKARLDELPATAVKRRW
jgi:sporulation protein YlmC with PRC-barrel domain